jgi:uncharacterized protein YjbI with pentapeptide repeats
MSSVKMLVCFLCCVFFGLLTAKADFPDKAFVNHIFVNGKKTELKDGIDLGGCFLNGKSFSRRLGNLKDIKFDRTDLRYACLSETMYFNCTFRSADMTGVDAADANFFDCDFTDAIIGYAEFGALSPKDIQSTNNYKNRDLSNIIIQFWHIEKDEKGDVAFDFSCCNLENTSLPVELIRCDFTDAKIDGAKFRNYTEKNVKSSFCKEQLYTTKSYKTGVLLNVWFTNIDFSKVNFYEINISGCKMLFCNLDGADFRGAIISNCDISSAKNLTVEQIKSTWNYKVGRMDGIELPPDIQKALDAEKKECGVKK